MEIKPEDLITEPEWAKDLPEYDCKDRPCIYPFCRTKDNAVCCFTENKVP
jgi:hypothetical protein